MVLINAGVLRLMRIASVLRCYLLVINIILYSRFRCDIRGQPQIH
ncbi:MAG: Uncharacterised protein [Gammaproteobacteria bacterium]|nr:MAG: Uncharacterised protein [Gammaproteobacteria bacterium]